MMDDAKTPLAETIRLALAAAETASDAATEVERAAGRLASAAAPGATPQPLAADRRLVWIAGAALAFGVASSTVSGLLFLRAERGMAAATATQTEALEVFARSVGDLTVAVKANAPIAAELTTAGAELTTAAQALKVQSDQLGKDLGQTVAEAAAGLQSVAPGLSQAVQGQLDAAMADQRAAVAAAISDLGVAMSKLIGPNAAGGNAAMMQELQLIKQSLGTLAQNRAAPTRPARTRPAKAADPVTPDPFVSP